VFETIFVPELRSILAGTLLAAIRAILIRPEPTLSRNDYAQDLYKLVFYEKELPWPARAVTFAEPPVVPALLVRLNNPIFRVTWKDPDDGRV
jgi:hypothetical protein